MKRRDPVKNDDIIEDQFLTFDEAEQARRSQPLHASRDRRRHVPKIFCRSATEPRGPESSSTVIPTEIRCPLQVLRRQNKKLKA